MYQRAGIPPSVDGTLSTVIEISKSLSDAYRFRRSRSSDGTRQHSPIPIKSNKSRSNTPVNSPGPEHHKWSSQGNPHKRRCDRCERHPELDCIVLIDGDRCESCRKSNKYCTLEFEWEKKRDTDHDRVEASRGRNQDHRLEGIPAIAIHAEPDKRDWKVLVREAEKLDSEIARFAWDMTREMEQGRTRAQVADMNQKISEFRDASRHFCHWSRRASEYMQ